MLVKIKFANSNILHVNEVNSICPTMISEKSSIRTSGFDRARVQKNHSVCRLCHKNVSGRREFERHLGFTASNARAFRKVPTTGPSSQDAVDVDEVSKSSTDRLLVCRSPAGTSLVNFSNCKPKKNNFPTGLKLTFTKQGQNIARVSNFWASYWQKIQLK